MPPHSLVVIKPGALGDTLLLAPALRALRTAYPALPITVVGSMPQATLLPLLGVAKRTVSIERFAVYHSEGRGAEILEGATVLAFLRPPEDERCDPLLARGARESLWRPSRPGRDGEHAARYLHACLRILFPEIPPLHRAPFVLPEVHARAATEMDPYAILAPGAGSSAKCLPLPRFLAMADKMRSRGVTPLFLFGETERENGLIERLPRQYLRVDCPPLEALARLLGQARHVFANDSGPAHLAGLLGVETTVFFGPTDPSIWRPWGPRIRVEHF